MSTHIPLPVSKTTQKNIDLISRETFLSIIQLVAGKGWTLDKASKHLKTPKSYLWIAIHNNPEWDSVYARAMQIKHDRGPELDTEDVDALTKSVKTGEYDPKTLNALVNTTKLRIETRHWLMERLNRTKYGQKLDINTTATVTHEAGESLQRLTGQDLQTMLMLERKAAGKLDPAQEVQPLNVQVVESVQQPEVKPLNMLNNTTKKSNPEIDVI